MDTQFAALDSKLSRYGLILEAKNQQQFEVLWMDGSVTSESLKTVHKAIWNSVTFFNFVDPERNKFLAGNNPLQLGLEILLERRILSAPKKQPVARAYFLAKLSEMGVEPTEQPRIFEKMKRAFKEKQEIVKLQGTGYTLLTEVSVLNPLPMPTPVLHVEKGAQSAVMDADQSSWDEFIGLVEDRSRKPSQAFAHPSSFAQVFQEIQREFSRLSTFEQQSVMDECRGSVYPALQLIGWMLFDTRIPTDAKGLTNLQALASQVFWHYASPSETVGSAVRVVLARLLKVAVSKFEIGEVTFKQLLDLADLLSTLSSSFVSVHLEAISESAKARIRAATAAKAGDIAEALEAMQWNDFKGDLVFEALLNTSFHPLSSTIWEEINFSGLNSLVQRIDSAKFAAGFEVENYLKPAVESFFAGPNHKERLQLLRLAPLIVEKIEPVVLANWIEMALSGSPRGRATLENIRGITELAEKKVALELEISKLGLEIKRHDVLQGNLAAAKKENQELRSLTEQLRLGNAKAKEHDTLQAEADAARKVVGLLTQLDEAVGPRYLANKGVKSALKSLRLEPFCIVGETVSFDQAKHNDPELKAQPGDRVHVLSSGYQWFGGSTIVVLRKALVSI